MELLNGEDFGGYKLEDDKETQEKTDNEVPIE